MTQTNDFDFLSGLFPRSESNPTAYDFLSGILGAAQVPAKPDGIWFARKNGEGVRFSEPTRLYRNTGGMYGLKASIPGGGVYAILVGDSSAYPRPFRVIYFGESENIFDRASSSHERYRDWCAAAGGEENLYVAYCWTYGTRDERTSTESDLIGHYHPECNIALNPLASIFAEYSSKSVAVPGAGSFEPNEFLSQLIRFKP